jgi:Methylamine utilisation protein MauE
MFIFALTLRFAVAIVLAVAACAKARSFGAFRETVQAIVPWHRGVSAIAALVVAIEATLAALLAGGVLPSAVAAATLALFLGFAGLSVWAARSGLRVQCSCFGRSDRELGKDTLVTSLLLAGATLAYLILLGRVEGSLSLGEVPLAAALGVGAVLGGRWLLTARELAAMVRQRRRLDRELEAGAVAQ